MKNTGVMQQRFSKDWKVEALVFPDIGKSRGIISKPWKTRDAFFQALERRRNQPS